jgi:AraC-like DNA-binding protein
MASFNIYTIIFFFAAMQGLFISLVIIFRKGAHPSRKVLAFIPFLFSLILFEYTLFWTHYDLYFPYLMGWSNCIIFLFGPLFYLYFASVFRSHIPTKIYWVHFVPFILSVLYLAPLLFASPAWKHDLQLQKVKPGLPYLRWYPWLSIAHMLAYLYLIIKTYYAISLSAAETGKWFKWLTGFFTAFITAYTSYFILVQFPFFNPAWDYAISFCMALFIYFLAWMGYMQPKVFSGFKILENPHSDANLPGDVKYKNSPLTAQAAAEIAQKLNSVMSTQKLFLQNDISLDGLATACGFSKHYISQAVNESLQMNFFEYINHLRIEEAKALLLLPKEELNVIDVAYRVGYNNKVSFNKAFKNVTGQTPTGYRANLTK